MALRTDRQNSNTESWDDTHQLDDYDLPQKHTAFSAHQNDFGTKHNVNQSIVTANSNGNIPEGDCLTNLQEQGTHKVKEPHGERKTLDCKHRPNTTLASLLIIQHYTRSLLFISQVGSLVEYAGSPAVQLRANI